MRMVKDFGPPPRPLNNQSPRPLTPLYSIPSPLNQTNTTQQSYLQIFVDSQQARCVLPSVHPCVLSLFPPPPINLTPCLFEPRNKYTHTMRRCTGAGAAATWPWRARRPAPSSAPTTVGTTMMPRRRWRCVDSWWWWCWGLVALGLLLLSPDHIITLILFHNT